MIGAIVIVAAGTLLGLVVPVPHSSSVDLQTSGEWTPVFQNLSLPIGAHVTGSWSTSNDTLAAFTIRTSPYNSGTTVYLPPHQETAGSFSFTATNSTYVVAVGSYLPCVVLVSYTYSAPLL